MFKTITIPFLSLVEYRVNISYNYTHTGNERFNVRLVLCLNILMCENWGGSGGGVREKSVYMIPLCITMTVLNNTLQLLVTL